MSAVSLEPCLVFNRVTRQWSLEDRPALLVPADSGLEWSDAEWSDELAKACTTWRKRGEISPVTRQERYRAKLRLKTGEAKRP